MSIEEQKEKLIAQGAVFRAQVILAKDDVHAGLRPVLLAKGAIGHLAATAMTAFGGGAAARISHIPAPGINLSTLLPLFAAGMSALPKGLLKKAVMLAAAAGAVGAAVALVRKKRGLARRD